MKCYHYVLLVSVWCILFAIFSLIHHNRERVEDVVIFTTKPCSHQPLIQNEKNNVLLKDSKQLDERLQGTHLQERVSLKSSDSGNEFSQPNHLIVNSPTPSIVYDPDDIWKWEGDVDYDAIAAAVLKRFRGEDEDSQPFYVVYNVDSTVGFANQFRSLSGIFLIALVSGRRLRINWGDYYDVMDSYFKDIRYSAKEVKYVPFKSYLRFPRGVCNMTKYQSHDVDQIFGKRHLSFNILTDLSCFVLPNPQYRDVLKRLGFDVNDTPSDNPVNGEDYRSIRRQIARLLLTPNAEITYHIRKNLKKFSHPVIGVQLRTGGSVSTTIESHRFLYVSSLSFVDQEIRYAMNKYQWGKNNITLFVTTDSGIVNRRMHVVHSDKNVIEGEGYRSGHSSAYLAGGPKHNQFLKRAVMDLVLISQSDYILFTHGSSYGRLAMRLSYKKPARAVCRDTLCTPFS